MCEWVREGVRVKQRAHTISLAYIVTDIFCQRPVICAQRLTKFSLIKNNIIKMPFENKTYKTMRKNFTNLLLLFKLLVFDYLSFAVLQSTDKWQHSVRYKSEFYWGYWSNKRDQTLTFRTICSYQLADAGIMNAQNARLRAIDVIWSTHLWIYLWLIPRRCALRYEPCSVDDIITSRLPK